MNNWKKRVKETLEKYVGFVSNEEVHSYICQFCGDTTYRKDWTDSDFIEFARFVRMTILNKSFT